MFRGAPPVGGPYPGMVPGPQIPAYTGVAKMASHAIFQYNVLVINDTHNTWTNVIVKMNIPRLLGSSDDKEKIGVARPEGRPESSSVRGTRIEETVKKSK